MEGRRVNRRNQKYNPLFVLFLCLVAAVAVLLIVSIVLGAKLGKTGKSLKTAETTIEDLNKEIAQLQDDLAAAQALASGSDSEKNAPDSGVIPGLPDAFEPVGDSSWLDLTGHTEVRVQPANLLDGYTAYYTTAGVNLRSGPATSYDRITTVDYGTQVQVAARQDNWSFVKVGNKFGWISSDYLSTSEPAPQKPAATTSTVKRAEATSGSLKH